MLGPGRRPTCDRTMCGDTERSYLPVVDCTCPYWRCPFCHVKLDWLGCCDNLNCFLVGKIVPIPEWA